MGEMAEMMVDGFLCEICGEYLDGDAPGHPRRCAECRDDKPKPRKRDRFDSAWSMTTGLLADELRHLGGRNVLFQMAVTEDEIRNDGWIRANARPSHPGVILTFDSKYGPLSYPCDTYSDWRANVRAIAVSLEWLRGVDRHGVTRRGEQYTGWRALPPAGGTSPDNRETVQRGERLIREHGSFKRALFATHPDHGGDVDDFRAVQMARGA